MITFKLTKQCFGKNTFFTKKTTPICNTINSFGYIKQVNSNFHSKKYAVIDWYDNFIRSELTFSYNELIAQYKSIYPYYNTKSIRGNVWKYSYPILLHHIDKDKGFNNIKIDKITYKILPVKQNTVKIRDAEFVLKNHITDLNGKIKKITKYHPIMYDIKTNEGIYSMSRCHFTLVPQDYFTLIAVRCNNI